MSFAPASAEELKAAEHVKRIEAGSAGAIFQPDPDEAVEAEQEENEPKKIDPKLGTFVADDDLHRRLLRMFYDARSSEQEQGVNTLFLAVGFLKWFEDDRDKRERFAPLILLPVQLERKNARTRFILRASEEDLTTNLSLQAKLKAEFNLDLPELAIEEGWSPSAYLSSVQQMIEGVDRWEVLPDDMVLSFFSFSRFLMYRDLDPAVVLKETGNASTKLLHQLLSDDGFADQQDGSQDDLPLEERIETRDMVHVVQADTSQALAIEQVRCGGHLVIQGPPGTGKSQTIANLIATAVKEGKRVLFVAEKMAALEVVKRRLDNIGLGEMCLELHSHKARKRIVLDDLEHTLSLGQPAKPTDADVLGQLDATQKQVNQHALTLHRPVAQTGITPFHAIGELIRLRAQGVPPADFTLDQPLSRDAESLSQAEQALAAMLQQVGEIGPPQDHPWRGTMLDSILPMDQQRLSESLPKIIAKLKQATGDADQLIEAMNPAAEMLPPATAELVQRLIHRAKRVAQAPPLDRQAITNDVWRQQRDALNNLVEAGLSLQATKHQLDGRVVDAAWQADLSQTRLDMAAYGRSWLRWMNGAYRRAKRTLQSVLIGPMPKGLEARLALLDQIIAAQKNARVIEQTDAVGRYAFGSLWVGLDSDFKALGQTWRWDERNATAGDDDDCRRLIASIDDATFDRLDELAQACERSLPPAVDAMQKTADTVELDTAEAFGVDDLLDVPMAQAAERFDRWHRQPESLSRWIAYRRSRDAARDAGMSELIKQIDSGDRSPETASDAYAMSLYEAVLRATFTDHPDLAQFHGQSYEKTLNQFAELDRGHRAWSRYLVAAAHSEHMPRAGGEVGQVGLLRREFQKKRRNLPLRRLLQEAGQAIQSIKPVFMMSPMSVAQYLEPASPNALGFDLLVMDEASQVRPVDALGAVSRCSQLVVVGDDKQLPPTRFFDTIFAGDAEDTDEAELDTTDLESILGLCTAQNVPSRMLSWHYRSRHPSLITVSNHAFYDGQLHIIPSPSSGAGDLGLRFHHTTEGHFDRGRSATHPAEARKIAEAVMHHAEHDPKTTLGVGTFSVGQRDAVLDELELMRRDRPDLEPFFAEDHDEPFFVKNLENIQGDERDVIFISVGYGRDVEGGLTMNFGPLSNEGGERRLNVLITRAKRRLEVFSPIKAEDIDLSRVSRRGPRVFRTFLQFARTGQLDTAEQQVLPTLSTFEQHVAAKLEEAGYRVQPRVGEAGLYVDLAVVDPEDEDAYILAILCDGPAYAAAASARERELSRSAVLEMMGWQTYRLWSLDWFNRPTEQFDRLVQAIESAKATTAPPRVETQPIVEVQREAAVALDTLDRTDGLPTCAYEQAQPGKLPRHALDDLTVFERIDLIRQIVEAEGPVHVEEVARRAADTYDQRLTRKLQDLLDQAIDSAVSSEKIELASEFADLPGRAVSVIRDRSEVASEGLRRPEALPPSEIQFSIRQVVRTYVGASRDEVIQEVARLLGFTSTRSALKEVLEQQLQVMIEKGELHENDGCLGLNGES